MIDFIKNLDFQKLKDRFNQKGKPLAIAGVCFLAVFIAGFGTGRVTNGGTSGATEKRSLTNYTTNKEDKTKSNNTNTAPKAESNSSPSPKTTVAPVDQANCYIKGSKSKTYHIPGGAFYERTTPAACFNSEEEAVAAGYKKSSR